MENTFDKGFECRKILKETDFGILSTMSADVPGYPFGSVTPYCLSDKYEPLILISSLAQHTKNIIQYNKVSLTVMEKGSGNVQTLGRVTILGDAIPEGSPEAKDKYLRYFPDSKEYFNFHDFSLYRIELKRVRYIGGFGKIFWLEPDSLALKNKLAEVENMITEHMNNDHKAAMFRYCRNFKKLEVSEVEMTGIDPEGFDLLADNRLIRFTFDKPVNNAQEARTELVKMAKSEEA